MAATAAAAVVAGLAATSNAGAAPASPKLAPGAATSNHSLAKSAKGTKPDTRLAGLPAKGSYAFLLKLSARSTSGVYQGAKAKGTTAAKAAAKQQLAAVTAAQNKVIAALPGKSRVLYRTHAALAGLAVRTDVDNYAALKGISGVTAVYPIAPKKASNSYAVPLQGGPEAWQAFGDRGENSTIAIIDTGVDYTHANFGGAGTTEEFDAATAQLGKPTVPGEFPGDKVIGGYDLAGDDYNADPSSDAYSPVPAPDPFPLDCNGHGSHVGGTAAGYGVTANGDTYAGPYNRNTPFDSLRIGPGMAPKAKLYAFRVFGCEGSTDLVGAAIDRAVDPDQNGDPSDHVNVVNMSLGSDFGSPQDGDSVATDAASAMGVTMVIASGNNGDLYDTGGSPGDAPSSIAVAASADAYAQVDALNVTAPASIAGPYAAERSVAYDYATKPDLSGPVARVTQPSNLDGCQPLNAQDAAAVSGKIGFVEWTDDDANRRCGSVTRSGNLFAAGATGFIFADDVENFSAGITGSTEIPGVLVAKSGGDAIRGQLLAGNTVTIGGTTANGFRQIDPALNDTLAGFTSRGIRDSGNVKPDVSAVGVSVFSTASGTGDQGTNESGTSMATPMVAGTAGLVTSLHPDWSPLQVKADIMNTAGQDLYSKTNHTGKKYAPNRVGAGRIDVKKALQNDVVAYVTDSPNIGAVSASFGPLAISAPTTLTKTIKVQNTSLTARSYDVTYKARTSVPGAEYTVSPDSVTVGPRSSQTVTVTLTIDPTQLTKTIDPTVDRLQADIPRQYVADASGLVVLQGAGVPNLRVPVYSAPRPASTMTQPASLTLPSGSVQSAFLPLTGGRVNQGSGNEAVQSLVAGFELQATSGPAPTCSASVTTGCVKFSDQRGADLKYVGVTSDAPQLNSIGENPLTSSNGLAFFAVSTQGPWRTVAGIQEFDVFIDGDRDGIADAVVFNTRLGNTDVMVSETIDLNTGDVLDIEGLNDSLGNTDTAMFDSDTIVLPVAIGAIPGVTSSKARINYAVQSYSAYTSGPLDTVGTVNDDLSLTNPLTFDVLHPGLAVYGSYNGDTSALLYADSPGSVLKVRRGAASYSDDKAKGALIVHFHNKLGAKAQVVSLSRTSSSVRLARAPNPVKRGSSLSGTVTVSKTSGAVPSGRVTLRRVTGSRAPAVIGSATLVNGTAKITYKPSGTGSFQFQATYGGDVIYTSGTSPRVTVKINP